MLLFKTMVAIMLKKHMIGLAIAAVMLIPMLVLAVSADASWAVFEPFEGVSEPMPAGNLVEDLSFDAHKCLSKWDHNGQSMDHISTSSGGYLRCYDIPHPTVCFDYKTTTSVPAGTYKFTGYFRTSYEGEVTELRFTLFDANHGENTNGAASCYIYPTHDEWLKVEFYVVFDSNFSGIRICGGPHLEYIQSFCIDNFSLERVNGGLPEGTTVPSLAAYSRFGTQIDRFQAEASNNGSEDTYRPIKPEVEEQYEVQGIMMNRDIDFYGSCAPVGESITEEMLKDYCYQYKNTHVTDFMINIFCQVAGFPSEEVTDFLDEYHYNMDNGREDQVTSNQKMMYIMYEQKGIDYVETFCETFKEIGINAWLSYRMNDAHGFDGAAYPENKITIPFYYDNPQYRRFQHTTTTDKYYQNILDYTHEGVREYHLKMINESLSLYDCYGIELDFQRDIYIWHMGGEYAGLDILTDFMREVNRIVAIYEEKYGHDIKVGLRCASDIQTNYDLGYDIIRWAAEGLLDMVNPTARWATTDLQIPVSMWAAVMHPYGVEVAPGIEWCIQISPSTQRSSHTLNSLSGAAANWFSQGADKLYFYNTFLGLTHTFPEEDRISTIKNNLSIGSGAGHFNMLTTVGSYEKVMNRDREVYVTYNDVRASWKPTNEVLPVTLGSGQNYALRMSTGYIPVGAEAFFMMSVDEPGIVDKCLQITDRTNFWVGAKVNTDYQLDTTKTYQVKMDVKCADLNAGLRPLNEGVTWYVGSNAVAGAVTVGSGTPVEGKDGWYTHTFNLVPNANGKFNFRLCGGVEAIVGAVASTEDIFIDNVMIYENGVPVVIYDFNSSSSLSGWSYDRGAHPDATGTLKLYSLADQCLQITKRTNFWVGAKVNTGYQLDTTKTYQVKMDVKCADLNAGLRPLNQGVTWYVGSNAVAGAVTVGSGSPILGKDGWYTHTFTLVPDANGAFNFRLCGGVEAIVGAVESTADIFIDNIVLYENGVPVLTYDFNDDSQFSGWSYDRGAHPDATGTVKAYSLVDQDSVPPTVYINGQRAEFVKTEHQATGMTNNQIMTFRIPECVYDDERFIIEFSHTRRIYVDYAKIYIKRPIE